MAHMKTIRGTTPAFQVVFKDAAGTVLDPSSVYDKVEILLYNVVSGNKIVHFTNEVFAEPEDEPEGYAEITPGATAVDITFTTDMTQDAESGDNKMEIWTTTALGVVECNTCIFNEFIDAKDVS